MTRTFCTLFDKNYLYQAVALHGSLLRHCADFRLYALCMDEVAYDMVTRMRSATLLPLRVEELLTPQAAAVRQRTTHGQFCWVCQPLVCRFVLERFGVDLVTYLESDSLFFSRPEPLFAELADRSASVVPHNFASSLDNTETAGLYCVQFNAFRADASGRDVLDYWTEACFKYDKSAPTLYPGQTSLDDWPQRFSSVAVLRHLGAGVAPWNVGSYAITVSDCVPYVNGAPVVFYHYHQYGRYRSGAHELGSYPLTQEIVDAFYRPYVQALREAEGIVRGIDPTYSHRRVYEDRTLDAFVRSPSARKAVEYLDTMKRRIRGRYNVYPDDYFEAPAAAVARR